MVLNIYAMIYFEDNIEHLIIGCSSTVARFPTIVLPTALPCCPVRGAPCPSTPVAPEPPRTAAVGCVRQGPTDLGCPPSLSASPAHQGTTALQVTCLCYFSFGVIASARFSYPFHNLSVFPTVCYPFVHSSNLHSFILPVSTDPPIFQSFIYLPIPS